MASFSCLTWGNRVALPLMRLSRNVSKPFNLLGDLRDREPLRPCNDRQQ
jgi:hypothetical protein